MRRAGVEFLAGTDAANPYCFPGFSLHEDLALLVQAGLTPIEALQSATLNPARFLGKAQDFCTVAQGKIADLVLLDADPLQDINNTRRIFAVMYTGELWPRTLLDAVLAKTEFDAAFQSLETAYTKHETALIYLKVDPLWDSVRSDPRFQSLLHRIGLKG